MLRTRKPARNAVLCSSVGCPTHTSDPTGQCSKCKQKSLIRNVCAICNGFPNDRDTKVFYCRNHVDLHKKGDNTLRFQTASGLKICQDVITHFTTGDDHRVKKIDPGLIRCEHVRLDEVDDASLKQERNQIYQEFFLAIAVFDRKMAALIERGMIKNVREGKMKATDLLDFCTTDDESGSTTDNSYWSDQGGPDGGSDVEEDQSTAPQTPVPNDL